MIHFFWNFYTLPQKIVSTGSLSQLFMIGISIFFILSHDDDCESFLGDVISSSTIRFSIVHQKSLSYSPLACYNSPPLSQILDMNVMCLYMVLIVCLLLASCRCFSHCHALLCHNGNGSGAQKHSYQLDENEFPSVFRWHNTVWNAIKHTHIIEKRDNCYA